MTNALQLVVTRDGHRPAGVRFPPETDTEEEDDDDADGYRVGMRELVVVIDGVAELQRWGGMGMDPDALLNPDEPLIPPADGSAVERALQRCSCGEEGCGSVRVTIRRRGDSIEWTGATADGAAVPIGPFTFDASAYEREVRRAHVDRPWETRTEHVARLVAEALHDLRGARPWSFDFASGSFAEGHVVVSVTRHEPHPQAGQRIGRAIDDGRGNVFYAVAPAERSTQVLGHFPIGEADERTEAERIADLVRSTDPRTW